MRQLGSLLVAVLLLMAIAGVLAWGTLYEQRFGTAAVQRFVYHAWWFQALLGFLALNLTMAALQRWPWRLPHAPFLLAHVGIILILIGGIIGGRFGIDGQLIIPEGQAERVLQLQSNVLVVQQPNPGTQQVLQTNFETTAWIHEPHALFHVLLQGRDIQLVVDRYYPDAAVDEQVTDDNLVENPAVQLAISQELQRDEIWLMARDPERFGFRWGQTHLLFLEPKTEQQVAAILGQTPATPSDRGVVTIEFPDLHVQRSLPVPSDFSQPIAIEGTPYLVTFKDYFTNLAITEHGIVNQSQEPNNPAVALVLSGPQGADAWLVFALHPDFAEMHGRHRTIPAHVTYTHHTGSPLPPNSIGVVRQPSGALSCVVTDEGGHPSGMACEVGHRSIVPGLGYQFELLAFYPHAKVTTTFRNRSDEIRAEALHLMAQEGQQTAETWLPLRGVVELPLGEHPIRVEYRPDQWELPFTIKLLDFRKIDYPGTQMAAGFESDVELSDPRRGVILMRKISMNNPLRYRGFSFFQSSYVPGAQETTILSVRNDPGTPFVYAGFLVVIAGVVSMFVLRAATRDH